MCKRIYFQLFIKYYSQGDLSTYDKSSLAFDLKDNGDIKFMNLNAWKAEGVTDLIKTYDNDISKFDCAISGILGSNSK